MAAHKVKTGDRLTTMRVGGSEFGSHVGSVIDVDSFLDRLLDALPDFFGSNLRLSLAGMLEGSFVAALI